MNSLVSLAYSPCQKTHIKTLSYNLHCQPFQDQSKASNFRCIKFTHRNTKGSPQLHNDVFWWTERMQFVFYVIHWFCQVQPILRQLNIYPLQTPALPRCKIDICHTSSFNKWYIWKALSSFLHITNRFGASRNIMIKPRKLLHNFHFYVHYKSQLDCNFKGHQFSPIRSRILATRIRGLAIILRPSYRYW